MTTREVERVLRSAGFVARPRSKHVEWSRNGVRVMVSLGTKMNPRTTAAVRLAIRRAERQGSGGAP